LTGNKICPGTKVIPIGKQSKVQNWRSFNSLGWGYRGGDFYNPELDLRVSARNVATFAGARRLFGLGFRAVKSAP